jgi:hypothetical protein
MPGNTVKINESNEMEWYVGDSRVDELLLWLDENGIKRDKPSTNINKMEALNSWISDVIFPGKLEDFIQVIKSFKTDKEEVKEFFFYTDEHRYRIYAVDRKDDAGYLGCQVLTRKMRPGEDWFRGNDLPDGPFIQSTWDNIMVRIVSYEMVKLSENLKPNININE